MSIPSKSPNSAKGKKKISKTALFELEIAFYIIIFVIYLLDQITKLLVHQNMQPGQSIPIIKNIFHFTYVQNTGAAFSLFAGFSLYLTLIGIVISTIIFYFHVRAPIANLFTQIALAFILGGSLGNLADRILRKYVIDFFDFRVWPVFNIADVMINVGVFLLVVQLLKRRT